MDEKVEHEKKRKWICTEMAHVLRHGLSIEPKHVTSIRVKQEIMNACPRT